MTAAPLDPDALGTLCGLFRARIAATPDQVAYRQFDEARDAWVSFSWAEVAPPPPSCLTLCSSR